ncbi:inner membrane transporter RhtA [Agromyces cerinus]|uniref:EamA family transporter n=1 Tax=Agromyces cerinus TaxID=33878 RepID=UPI001956C204|nr:EamA family transporter [Agromyces cerinus]MBM7832720.1 inner membrane transporter RhtA [Agromyces cerinus]
MRTSRTTLRRALLGFGVLLIASTSVQVSAVISHGMFDRLGPLGVSGLRFAIAAVLAAVLIRPRLTGRTRAEWLALLAYGTSIAAMNVCFHVALEFVPLGVAITVEFLGPFLLAALGVRRLRLVVFPLLGLGGVALIARPTPEVNPIGLIAAGVAGVSLASYTLLAERIGRTAPADRPRSNPLHDLTIAVVVAAVLTAPFGVAALPAVETGDLAPLGVAAVLGVLIAFGCDMLAVRLTSARTVAVLFSFDPALAAIIGMLLLGQLLDPLTIAGIVLVCVAGAATIHLASAAQRPAADG